MKRFIALLLSFLLIFCVMPIVSAAEEAPTSVMNVLQELGAQNPKVVRQTRSSNLYDNLVDNPATAIEFSNTSYAFLDGNGKIVRNFCVDFWSYISSSYTVYEAAQDAADNGTGRPIEFTGDIDYNGYY